MVGLWHPVLLGLPLDISLASTLYKKLNIIYITLNCRIRLILYSQYQLKASLNSHNQFSPNRHQKCHPSLYPEEFLFLKYVLLIYLLNSLGLLHSSSCK